MYCALYVYLSRALWYQKDGSEDRHTAQTRPDIPHGVYLEVRCPYRVLAFLTPIQSMDYARDDVYSHEEKRKAWETVASMTLYHNDAMVERWNKEIDTYLVFVRSTEITELELRDLPIDDVQGRPFLCSPHRIQCSVVHSAPAGRPRSLACRIATDVCAADKLLDQSSLYQLYPAVNL